MSFRYFVRIHGVDESSDETYRNFCGVGRQHRSSSLALKNMIYNGRESLDGVRYMLQEKLLNTNNNG